MTKKLPEMPVRKCPDKNAQNERSSSSIVGQWNKFQFKNGVRVKLASFYL